MTTIDHALLAHVTGGAATSDELHAKISGLTQQVAGAAVQEQQKNEKQAQSMQLLQMMGGRQRG